MAPKPSHDKLIHCDVCGEDYSATYRRCPFCGERSDPRRTSARNDPASSSRYIPTPPAAQPGPARGEEELDDGYVFDGQDAFDDEPEEEYYAPRPKGGKRLAPKQGGRGTDLPPINWPRLITFLCSLIIIVAALVIVFTFIYPQLHGENPPKPDSSEQPSAAASLDPGPGQSADVTVPSAPVDPVDPVIPSQAPVDPVVQLISITQEKEDFALWVGQSYQIKLTFAPAGWTGPVTYTSSNPEWASVSETGEVKNVNASGAYHNCYITIAAGGITTQCVVRVYSKAYEGGTAPTQSSAPTVDPPAAVTPAPSGGGTVTVGRPGTIVNAEGGLRVRSGPGTSYEILASLENGNSITVVAASENGWYQISFRGSGGSTMTGYIMGEYISTN